METTGANDPNLSGHDLAEVAVDKLQLEANMKLPITVEATEEQPATTTITSENKFGVGDFLVHSAESPRVTFSVERAALINGSDVFRDMFQVCEVPDEDDWHDLATGTKSAEKPSSMVMPENADVLQMLFRLLHEASAPLPDIKLLMKFDTTPANVKEEPIAHIPGHLAIPLPLLRPLFAVADKYLLTSPFVSTLHSQLAAHVVNHPLEVYALATTLSLDDIAFYASAHLHHPPLHTYSPQRLSVLPTIESLHKLYQLHSHRITCLQEIVSNEALFPNNYGKTCERGHYNRSEEAWRNQKRYLTSMSRIQAGTDIAKEMAIVMGQLDGCAGCIKACNAAVEMIRYKARKVPRTINKIPNFAGDGTRPTITR